MARPALDTPNFRLGQHTNGVWYVRWWRDGKAQRVSTRTTDRSEAEAFLSRLIAGTQEPPPPDTCSIKQILEGYLEDRHERVAAHNTLQYACKALKRHLGELSVEAITVRRCRLYADQRRAEGYQVGPPERRVTKPTADGTIIRELVTLRAAIRWAIAQKWLRAQDEPRIEVPSAGPSRQRWLTRDEAQRLLDACERPHMKLFVALGLYTAARTGAILDLTWDEVDFVGGIINFGEGRGNKGRVPVPIAPPLRPYLLQAHSGACTSHVIEQFGKSIASIKTGFNAAVARAGLGDDVTPHILRHTAATWMIKAGVTTREVARLLGNTEKMVEEVYGHYAPDYLRDAVHALSAAPAL